MPTIPYLTLANLLKVMPAHSTNRSFIKKKALVGVACVTTPMSGVCDMRHKAKSSWRRHKSMAEGVLPATDFATLPAPRVL